METNSILSSQTYLKMLSLSLIPLLLASAAWAETPPGIAPNATARLDVIYPNVVIDPPGKLIKQAGNLRYFSLSTFIDH